ncbi:alkaline phosphatase family protein [Microlunatus capsulatus]|uniref:Phosphoesterase family protein n=1 Tax=Microlunatus capsulatus TaxID=99117 RepID=A0ABS4Z3G1_9ACTN|nr:alkaline phosphatase family protein [Microlunatus capsulatus]MBP2415514.1 hypothetical protein [Microlunatus capsulatus]
MTSAHHPRARAPRRLLVAAALLALVAGGLTAAGASVDPAPAVAATTASALVPRPDHVVVVVLENKNRTSVIGSAKAPYINALAARGANLSQSYGVTHPSQPNYVALFSGSQHGVTTNACRDLGAKPNLGSQLRADGLSFTGYAESLPSVGWTGCRKGEYERKHNPWVDFSNLPKSVNQPFSAFPRDYTELPTVSFVTPNMCHDMHDCSVATGDAWLKKNLDGYARWAMTHNSLLVVTFDENAGGTVNQIPTLLVGQKVRPGLYAEWTDHYTLLRTIEDAYGLAPLGAAARATPLRTIWTSAPKPRTGLSNAGFESRLSAWATSGRTTTSTNNVHGGDRSGRAGALTATRGDSILSQTFVVPAGRSRLTLWWQGRCSDTVGKAWATVVVKRNTSAKKSTLLPKTCVRKGAWKKVGVDVTPGHSYTLQLVNHDDGKSSTPNRTYFDDVTLR